ncbi:MAG: stage V sporulation protein AE [Oscillospiraceae bacterium]|nr:stage V sporulation protein AE [Oscillospiraceae bacterium]
MDYVNAFWVGGLICAAAQILIDKTKLSPGRILTLLVVAGVILGFVGVYGPFENFAGAGATVPITGFGYALARGAVDGARESGILGAFTGGVKGTAAGIAAAIFFGFLIAVIFKPRQKR